MTPPGDLRDWSAHVILMAEAPDDNYAVLTALLKQTSLRTVRANDGTEAVAILLARKNIKVVLTDIRMPGITGIEALQCIHEQIPGKTVIAQTAHELPEEIANENFDDYIQKPIRRKQLIETLSKYLPQDGI